jgi:hypothetical protein
MERESEPVRESHDAADRENLPLREGDADGKHSRRTSIEVQNDVSGMGAPRAEGAGRQFETESSLTEEERLHGVLMRHVLQQRLASWRSVLVPGGLRLMAREMRLDRVLVGGRAPHIERSMRDAPRSRERQERGGPTAERLTWLVELISITVSRLLVLRVAGLRRKEQARLRNIARTHG